MPEEAAGPNATQAAGEGTRAVTHLEPVGVRRLPSEAQLQPDPRLIAEGWQRRFVADGHRAQEAIELYVELGYEVHAEPIHLEDLPEACEGCRLAVLLEFKTIYTRKRGSGEAGTEQDTQPVEE